MSTLLLSSLERCHWWTDEARQALIKWSAYYIQLWHLVEEKNNFFKFNSSKYRYKGKHETGKMVWLWRHHSPTGPWICMISSSWMSRWHRVVELMPVPARWKWGSPWSSYKMIKIKRPPKDPCGTPYPVGSWQVMEFIHQVRGRNTPRTGHQSSTAQHSTHTQLSEQVRFSWLLAVFWDCGAMLEQIQR